jgi:hypothetical protein
MNKFWNGFIWYEMLHCIYLRNNDWISTYKITCKMIIIQFSSVQFNSILCFLRVESRATRPITGRELCRPCQHIVDNYIIQKVEHKDNNHKASFGNRTVGNYIQQQRKRKCNKCKKNNTNKQKGSYVKSTKSDNSRRHKLKLNLLPCDDLVKQRHIYVLSKILIFLPYVLFN